MGLAAIHSVSSGFRESRWRGGGVKAQSMKILVHAQTVGRLGESQCVVKRSSGEK